MTSFSPVELPRAGAPEAFRGAYEPPVLTSLGLWTALTLQVSLPGGASDSRGFLLPTQDFEELF